MAEFQATKAAVVFRSFMSVFKRHRPLYNDLSTRLRDVRLWIIAPEATRLEPVNNVCALCVDVYSRLLAVGTSHGEIRVYDEQFKETILGIPKAAGVRIIQFARSRDLFKLLCIDNKNILHVWNLDAYGIPPLQLSRPLDGLIQFVHYPLKPYWFVHGMSGICFWVTAELPPVQAMPMYRDALLASQSGDVVTFDLSTLRLSPYRIPYALENQRIRGPAIDVAILPNKLNHVLVGYEDGIVLYDLVSKKVLKAYAPESSPVDNPSSLTTLNTHPLGQHIAAGYVDGTICVWDMQFSKCVWFGTTEGVLQSSDADNVKREPIFKMEWTLIQEKDDSSSTWLTVLGGQRLSGDSHNCVSVLGFNTARLHSANADATSGMILGRFSYPVSHPAQDFAIIPPRTASTTAQIFLLSGNGDRDTTLDAFEFPPELHQASNERESEDEKVVELEFSAELEESEERTRDLAATLDDLSGDTEDDRASFSPWNVVPARVSLPFQLLIGSTSVLGADIFTVDQTEEYLRLVGGAEGTILNNQEDSYRILVTRHKDDSIRFYDVSILSDGAVDRSLHPRALEHLVVRVLDIPEIALRPDIRQIHTAGVAVASESLECAVTLSTGEVVVLGLGLRPRTIDVMDDELIDLSDVRDNGDIYSSRFILRAQNGGADVVCLSDIGFLAVAFRHGLLVIVDMRGPRIILRDAQDATSKTGEANIAKRLYWAVSGIGDDDTLAPRLLALRQDGVLTVYTLARSNGEWTVDKSRTTRDAHHALSTPSMSFVLNIQNGTDRWANAAALADAMDSTKEKASTPEPSKPHSLWVAANRREIRCGLNITGDKVSKVNFSSHDALDHTSLVSMYGSSSLITISRDQGTVYSLPSLEAIYSFQLPAPLQTSSFTRCTQRGDLLQTYRSSGGGITVVFTSLLIHSHPLPSGNVNFRIYKYSKKTSPESATKVEQGSSWNWGSSVAWIKSFADETIVSGDEIDILFAGSEVPNAVAKPNVQAQASPPSTNNAAAKGKKPASGATWGQGMYEQLASAAAERGERLGQLEDHFKSLEAGSKDMVAQAKKLAEREAAKRSRWFL